MLILGYYIILRLVRRICIIFSIFVYDIKIYQGIFDYFIVRMMVILVMVRVLSIFRNEVETQNICDHENK